MKGIKAVIFDLDGVIINTDIYHYQAWKRIAASIDVPFNEEMNNKLRGVSRMESLDIILDYAGRTESQDTKQILARTKNSYYIEYLQKLTPETVTAEILGTLESLKVKGYKLAIGSSSQNARMILKQLKLEHLFDAISDGTNITRSKPDPEVFLKAAEYMCIYPSECIVVEDAVSGILAGHNAGMKTIVIGAAAEVDLADFTAKSFSDIENILTDLTKSTVYGLD